MVRVVFARVALTGMLVMTACAGGSEPLSIGEPGPSFTQTEVFTRSCGTQIRGGDVRARSASRDRIGPLTLFGLSSMAEVSNEEFEPNEFGGLVPMKFITQIDGDEPVWLAVAAEHRDRAALIYDASKMRPSPGDTEWRFRLDAGSVAVRFDTCHGESGFTQYNGGIVVSGAGCVTLEVYVGSMSNPPLIRAAPFGSGSC